MFAKRNLIGVFCVLIGLAVIGCSKKEEPSYPASNSVEPSMSYTPEQISAIINGEFDDSPSSSQDISQKYVQPKFDLEAELAAWLEEWGDKITPADRFKYEFTDDLEALKITSYEGRDKIIVIPHEIEGVPVREIGSNTSVFFDHHLNENNAYLEKLIFPPTMTVIGGIYRCSVLKEVYIPNSVTTIAESAFSSCKSLEKINIPESVKEIGKVAFSYCGLKSLIIPDSVELVGERIIEHTEELEYLKFPRYVMVDRLGDDILTSIVDHNSSKKIKEITLPEKLTKIDLYHCNAMERIIIPNGDSEDVIDMTNGILKGSDIPNYITLLKLRESNISTLEIPPFVNEWCFSHNKKLEEVILPDNLIEIPSDAFSECTSLKSITLPASIKSICEGSFSWCSSLKEIIVSDTVTSIDFKVYNPSNPKESYMFRGCAFNMGAQQKLRKLGYEGQF